MTTFLSCIGSVCVLATEGFLLSRVVGRTLSRSLRWSLAYPIGALCNVLVFFVAYLLGFPLTALTVGSMHAAVILILVLATKRQSSEFAPSKTPESSRGLILLSLCAVSLGIVILSSVVYALDLPTYYWDSFTNWHMRSLQMMEAQTLLFRGVEKPQYPILIHALQMLPALFAGWSDRAANAMTFILSVTGFLGLATLLRRTYGTKIAIVVLAVLLSVPLAIIHLRQGYADIHVAMFLLLSALLLDRYIAEREASFLLLSFLFCLAAVWTKMEGFFIGVPAWLAVVLLDAVQSRMWKRREYLWVLSVAPLTLLWISLVLSKGLRISPDGAAFGLHFAEFPQYVFQLFLQASFGIHTYAIAALLLALLFSKDRKAAFVRLPSATLTLFGLLTFLLVSFVYLCTAEVSGLLDRNSFSRTMLIPVLLLTLALSVRGALLFFGTHRREP